MIYFEGAKLTRDHRSLNDWATLIVACRHPELDITHPEILLLQRREKFQQLKKELAA